MPYMKTRKRKAFSLVELLISLIILGILGGGAVTALYYVVTTYAQIDDYTAADLEIEHAVQRLTREFALVGLGMPNNRGSAGSFAFSFLNGKDWNKVWQESPIMLLFGRAQSSWGGPVTVAVSSDQSKQIITAAGFDTATNSFIGPELFYAWGVPTGIKARITEVGGDSDGDAVNNEALQIGFFDPNHKEVLQNFRWDFWEVRDIGLETISDNNTTGINMRTWITFPHLRLPLLAERWEESGIGDSRVVSLDVTAGPLMAPDALADYMALPDDAEPEFRRAIMELDEVHMVQAGRIYLDEASRQLRRVIFDRDYRYASGNYPEDILARNVVALRFAYNTEDRLLSMYIAVRGSEEAPLGNAGRLFNGGSQMAYPSWLPEDAKVPQDMHYRSIGKTFTWRIRN